MRNIPAAALLLGVGHKRLETHTRPSLYTGCSVSNLQHKFVDWAAVHCSPRNIALAIWNDEELNKLTLGTVIRDSGVLPKLHAALLPRTEEKEETGAAAGSFDLVFMDMLKAAPNQILIDPRDGCHKGLFTDTNHWPPQHKTEETICSLPALDAACANTRQSRQLKALKALTDEQRSAFNSGAYGLHGYGYRRHGYTDTADSADTAELAAGSDTHQGEQTAEARHAHLQAAHHLRIQAVRDEQMSTAPLFDAFAFDRLTREIAGHYR